MTDASQDSSLPKVVATIAVATAIFLAFKAKDLHVELSKTRTEKSLLEWRFLDAGKDRTLLQRELANVRAEKRSIQSRLDESEQKLRKAPVPLKFLYWDRETVHRHQNPPQATCRGVILTGFGKAPELDALLSKVTDGGIESISTHRQKTATKDYYHVIIIFLDAEGASTFVHRLRKATSIEFDHQKVGVSYVPSGIIKMHETVFDGIVNHGWSRVLVIAVPSPLVALFGVDSTSSQTHERKPRNQQYWSLFSEEEAHNIPELPHVDADHKDIVKIYRGADGEGIRTHFLIYLEFTSVTAAVDFANTMSKNIYLRGCQRRFAPDPCGGIKANGVTYKVGNIHTGGALSQPVELPRAPSTTPPPAQPTFHAEFAPSPKHQF